MRPFLIDSVSAVTAEMRGQCVVTGSHGGVSAAHLALAHPPGFVAFNDAGFGLDNAGIASLEILEQAGVAAFTVSHASARIGDAASTLATGRVSAANACAARLGVGLGDSTRDVVDRLLEG